MTQPALVVIGTRPELIKLGPVIRELSRVGAPHHVVFTHQHHALLAPTAAQLAIHPDEQLDPAPPGLSLSQSLARQLAGLDPILARLQPACVIAQGDTSAALAAAHAALYHHTPLVHVEAGLRSASLWSPHPEEGHRRAIAALASLHMAPTTRARDALLAEGVPAHAIHVTGNTAIDALREVVEASLHEPPAWLDPDRPPVLITMHRRENMGAPLDGVIEAARQLAAHAPVVWALHPATRAHVTAKLAHVPNVRLCEPLPYLSMLGLLSRAALVITDSGGLQEEAPALGVHVLIARQETERTEGVALGLATLTGCDPARLLAAAHPHLAAPRAPLTALYPTPYGDGYAARRIVAVIRQV
jgi:UDP-N-acetylglucosamine 2-epimerase (non-hydrolysing)